MSETNKLSLPQRCDVPEVSPTLQDIGAPLANWLYIIVVVMPGKDDVNLFHLMRLVTHAIAITNR